MSHYEEEMVGRIREVIVEHFDCFEVDVPDSTFDWMATDLYSALEDEFRGPT